MSCSISKASFDLITTFITVGDLSQAQKAFDAMATLDNHEDTLILRAKASSILYAYGEYASYLENVQKAFDDRVATLGDNEDDAIERARASVALLSAYRGYDSDRHEEDVKKVFDDLKGLLGSKKWRSRDCDLGYASSSMSLLSVYGNYARHMEDARKVFDAMAALGDNEEIALERAKAALDLMRVYMKPIVQEIRDLEKAQRNFRRVLSNQRDLSGEMNIDKVGFAKEHDKKFGTKYATLSADLVSAHAHYPSQVKKVQKVFDTMASLGDNEEIFIERAKASLYLVNAYIGSSYRNIDREEIKDLQSARAIYKGMATLGDYKEVAILRTKVAFNLMEHYGYEADDLQKAKVLLDEMATLGDYEEITSLRADASSSLIVRYSIVDGMGAVGDLKNARAVFDAMIPLDNFISLVLASTHLIEMYCQAGDLEKAEALIDDMEIMDVQNTMADQHARGFVDVIDVYREAGDLEKAQALLERMVSLGDDRDIVKRRARATVNLIADYCKAGDCKKAQSLFDGMAALAEHEEIVECRTKAKKLLDKYK